MIVDSYQTLEDRDNVSEIEANGPYQCKHNQSWLGQGCYLWDTNIHWAHNWGETAYKSKGKDYLILHCKVDLSNDCFDLFGSVEHQQGFIEVMEVLKKSGKVRDEKGLIVSNIIQFMKNKGIFPFKSIRAFDQPKKQVQVPFRKSGIEQITLNQRVQICVITKKDVVLFPIKVIFSKKM
ncbi:hypothetical protein EZS27_027641 [termite gut metagenome]|uniref:Uncharacterized protein n=1 Tax=termite gut metagenome TaxID=433724 RepID=A0A5J4QPJ0_9ZZZZ